MKILKCGLANILGAVCLAAAATFAAWPSECVRAATMVSAEKTGNVLGYFIVFPFKDGKTLLPSVMATKTYVPATPALKGNAWRILLLDAGGSELFSSSLDNPYALMNAEDASSKDVQLVARVPNMANGARLELLDPSGVVAWTQPLDGAFVQQARNQAASVATLAARAIAPRADAGEEMVRIQMEFAERRRDADAARWAKTLGDPNAPTAARAAAFAKLHPVNPAPAPAGAGSMQGGIPGPLAMANTSTTQLNLVSGLVSASGSGTIMIGVPVRVYSADGQTYVTEATTDSSGHYNLEVPAGTYVIEADVGGREFVQADKALYVVPQRVSGVAVNAATTQNISIPLPSRTLVVNLKTVCTTCSPSVAISVSQSGNILANPLMNSDVPYDGIVNNGDGTLTFTWKLSVSPGVYDLNVNTAVGGSVGVGTANFTGVVLTQNDQSIEIGSNPSPPWTGRLLDSTGNPLTNKYFTSYDGLFHPRGYATTDSNGNFSIAVAPGWVVEFPAAETGTDGPLNYTVSDLSTLPATVQTPAISLGTPIVNGNATRIYTGANPDGERLRLFFIGDGYTTVHETYTDTNGNGVWDGVLWYDLNQNGVWDAGEPYMLYGDAVAPTQGTNPSLQNEPFTDLNGDGFPNFDDQSLFLENVQQFTRQLLGADYWSTHRDVFQVDATFVPSTQSGLTITNSTGSPIYAANTAFGSTTSTAGWVLNLNMTNALQVAEQLDPGFDCLIVMSNEPIPVARANETVGAAIGEQAEVGGAFGVDVNTPIIGHEMGHFVGMLADEYDFGAPVYGQITSIADTAANLTRFLSLNTLPWASFVTASQPLPDLVPHAGIGVFETALGWYRPTWNSIMRGAHLFNAPSVAALDAGLPRFTTERPHDYDVLVSLFQQAGGANWTTSTGWGGVRGTECLWSGITCDGWGRVVSIVLSNNNLVGTLPASLSTLTHLQLFQAGQNQLTGTIPQLSAMQSLELFDVDRNQLTGAIPSLTGLTKLQQFVAFSNQLAGPLPSLSGLGNLQSFSVVANNLTGSIPSLQGLVNLQSYYVGGNRLTGSVPSLTGLSGLQYFDVSVNHLTGSIPPLTGLSNLTSFQVGYNELSGSVPSLSGLSSLQSFYVFQNLLTGTIPPTPSPDNLIAGRSGLCANLFTTSTNAGWDAATGSSPWYAGCGTLPGVTVTAQAGANGSISPSGTQSLAYGASATLAVTPNSGFFPVLDSTCGGALTGTQYVTGHLTYPCTVNASFEPDSIFANGFE